MFGPPQFPGDRRTQLVGLLTFMREQRADTSEKGIGGKARTEGDPTAICSLQKYPLLFAYNGIIHRGNFFLARFIGKKHDLIRGTFLDNIGTFLTTSRL